MKEALESTKIEGTQASLSDVYEVTSDSKKTDNVDVNEVLNYSIALFEAFRFVEQDGFIASRTLKNIHSTLLRGNVRGKNKTPGEFRKVDNWIGAGIEQATYFPPSHIEVSEYIQNLERYINQPDTDFLKFPVVARAAIIHAQFESIHPFLDGNGRVGRILIPTYFRLYDEKVLSNIFISQELEQSKFEYYNMLNATRKDNPDWVGWIMYFMKSTIRSLDQTQDKFERLNALYEMISKDNDPSYEKVQNVLFRYPILNVKIIVQETSLSPQTIRRVLDEMVEKRIITKGYGKRNIKYYFYELIRIIA